jgi:DNA polymerase-4
MARARALSPLVQQISIDEAFVDVSDLPEPLEIIARRLQTRIREELHLPCSLGGATNKLVAKIANDFGKRRANKGDYPNAITIVPPGEEAAFLAPLPVRALWGVGPSTEEKLHALDIVTIGQLAQRSEKEMARWFGQHGWDLVRRARGIDNRPVAAKRDQAKSISKETTFARDVSDGEVLEKVLRRLAEGVAHAMRRQEYQGRTIKLKLRLSDFTTLTRQTTLPKPTDDERVMTRAVLTLFRQLWVADEPVRLVGVGVTNLQQGLVQLSLWEGKDERFRQLQQTVDALRDKYGGDVIRKGVDDKDF